MPLSVLDSSQVVISELQQVGSMSVMFVTGGSSSLCTTGPHPAGSCAVSAVEQPLSTFMPAAQLTLLTVLWTPLFGLCAACHVLIETLLHTGMIVGQVLTSTMLCSSIGCISATPWRHRECISSCLLTLAVHVYAAGSCAGCLVVHAAICRTKHELSKGVGQCLLCWHAVAQSPRSMGRPRTLTIVCSPHPTSPGG